MKATPHFNDMMAARGGMGMSAKGPKAAAPPKAPPKGAGKKAWPPAPDTDRDGM